jgi:3-dehydroquinate synthase
MKTHTNPWGDAVVGWGALEALGRWMEGSTTERTTLYFLVDEHTHSSCLPLVLPLVPDGRRIEILEVAAGESSKDAEIAFSLWQALREHGAHRTDVLVAVGGGMVTDLGGFVASTYKRGMPYVAVPTSLLAMVDASVGGKSGVNLPELKNAVGTFYRASGVFVDPVFLETLPPREVAAGWAEMIKHAYLDGGLHWKKISAFADADADLVEELVDRSVGFKAALVAQDPLDQTGQRAALNAGHTVAHALEALAWTQEKHGDGSHEASVLHGEAVAAGLWMESFIAQARGLQPVADAEDLRSLIRTYFAGVPLGNATDAWNTMQQDKKNESNAVRMALLTAPGSPTLLAEVVLSEWEAARAAYQSAFRSA